MNLIDLPTVMRQHSEHVPAPVTPDSRIAGVKRRVDASRRRRTAVGLAAVVAIVAGISFVADARGGGRTEPPAGASPVTAASAVATINGFPEYAVGGHLVATQTAALNKSISLTVTPTEAGLVFSNRCAVVDRNVDIEITVVFGGGHEATLGCTTSGGNYASVTPTTDPPTTGAPTSVTFSAKAYRVTSGSDGDQTERTPVALPSGTYSVGVWQKLPFVQYPLPPRPKTLPLLDINQFGLGGTSVRTVRSDPTDPLAPRTISFTMPKCAPGANCNPTAATSQTPGFLHIAVNGVDVDTAEFWDYSGSGSMFNIEPTMPDNLHLHGGELVTITITPQYVTGAWEFAVAPGSQG